MYTQQSIFIYILIFLIISILLKIFGFVNFNNSEILGYSLIFYGIGLVFISFGKERRATLFLGTTVFLIGILLFVVNNFVFEGTSEIIFPSVFFILGIGFLMLFLDEIMYKTPLYVAIIFILFGLIFTIFIGSPGLISFIEAIPLVTVKALPFLIITGLLFLLLRKKGNR